MLPAKTGDGKAAEELAELDGALPRLERESNDLAQACGEARANLERAETRQAELKREHELERANALEKEAAESPSMSTRP